MEAFIGRRIRDWYGHSSCDETAVIQRNDIQQVRELWRRSD